MHGVKFIMPFVFMESNFVGVFLFEVSLEITRLQINSKKFGMYSGFSFDWVLHNLQKSKHQLPSFLFTRKTRLETGKYWHKTSLASWFESSILWLVSWFRKAKVLKNQNGEVLNSFRLISCVIWVKRPLVTIFWTVSLPWKLGILSIKWCLIWCSYKDVGEWLPKLLSGWWFKDKARMLRLNAIRAHLEGKEWEAFQR